MTDKEFSLEQLLSQLNKSANFQRETPEQVCTINISVSSLFQVTKSVIILLQVRIPFQISNHYYTFIEL